MSDPRKLNPAITLFCAMPAWLVVVLSLVVPIALVVTAATTVHRATAPDIATISEPTSPRSPRPDPTTSDDAKTLDGLAGVGAYVVLCKPDWRPETYENLSALTLALPFSERERRAAVQYHIRKANETGVDTFCAFAANKLQPVLRSLGE